MSLNEHYEAVLSDLQQMKADAEDGIRAIKRLLSRAAASGPGTPRAVAVTTSIQEDTGSIPNRIVAFLESRQGRTFTTKEIFTFLGKVNMKTLRGALARLAKQGKIGKHGRGRYRARRTAANSEAA